MLPETNEELLSEKENQELLKSLEQKGGITPANNLRAYRYRQGLTQKELAKKSGISQTNISAMESDRRPIGLNAAKKLSKVLKCNYKKLI